MKHQSRVRASTRGIVVLLEAFPDFLARAHAHSVVDRTFAATCTLVRERDDERAILSPFHGCQSNAASQPAAIIARIRSR